MRRARATPAPPRTTRTKAAGRRPARVAEPPAIILVKPQLGENIGFAARAMANFGLTDLRLVSPRDGSLKWNKRIGRAAASPGFHLTLRSSLHGLPRIYPLGDI